MTIFSQFNYCINNSLKDMQKKNVSLESLKSETDEKLKKMRRGFEEKYKKHAKAFTNEMDPKLRYLAVGLVKLIVNAIFQKSMDKWRDL